MNTKVLTDAQLQALLPTISVGNEEPRKQLWFTRIEVLKIMRDLETEILKRENKHWIDPIPLG